MPGRTIVSDTRRRSLSTSITQTLNDVAHRHHVVRIADELVGQPADVNQAAVVHADVDEAAEIDHVQHRAGQLHAGRQVFQLDDAAFEDRRGQILAGIAARPDQLRQNVRERQRADLQLLGQRFRFDLGDALGQGGGRLLLAQIGRRAVQPLQAPLATA